MTKSLREKIAEAKQSSFYAEELALLSAHQLLKDQLNASEDLSQVDIARKLECSEAHVSKLLSAGRNLTIASLGKLCWALGNELVLQWRPMKSADTRTSWKAPMRACKTCNKDQLKAWASSKKEQANLGVPY